MDFWSVLDLLGGLCLFLFGMSLMGVYLEKSAGDGLKSLLGRLTSGRARGFLTGLGVTAVIQSSSATTVMVVGFVNSGLMSLRQAIHVIMGANVGTTVTAWLLSLGGIESDIWYIRLLKPSSFSPLLALVGILLYIGCKSNRKKDIGVILLSFVTLLYGMDRMSASVAGLENDPTFTGILSAFSSPIMGVLVGMILTAIIQSSSASVGILQAISSTGRISIGMSIPIIMGQNIGTCVTALLSSIGTNRNARRASLVHLSFNVIGTTLLLSLFCIAQALFPLSILQQSANEATIAICHTSFNILCTAILLPCASLLEKLSLKLIPEPAGTRADDTPTIELDERLMTTPAIAVARCRDLTRDMATLASDALLLAMDQLSDYRPDAAALIRKKEDAADHYEDLLGSYLVKLNTHPMTDRDGRQSGELLRLIGDFERISDHAVGILDSAEELHRKNMHFSQPAVQELQVLTEAVREILRLTGAAFDGDQDAAARVEPLEQVIDGLCEQMRTRHIARLQKGSCSIEAGFIWSDLLTNFRRVSDHCSNVAGCIIETAHESLDLHDYLRGVKSGGGSFTALYNDYTAAYHL